MDHQVVSQVEVQEEVEPLEEPCLVEGVERTLMGRPCNKIVQGSVSRFCQSDRNLPANEGGPPGGGPGGIAPGGAWKHPFDNEF